MLLITQECFSLTPHYCAVYDADNKFFENCSVFSYPYSRDASRHIIAYAFQALISLYKISKYALLPHSTGQLCLACSLLIHCRRAFHQFYIMLTLAEDDAGNTCARFALQIPSAFQLQCTSPYIYYWAASLTTFSLQHFNIRRLLREILYRFVYRRCHFMPTLNAFRSLL